MKSDPEAETVRLRLRAPASSVPKARNSLTERPNGPLMGFQSFSKRLARAEDGVTVLVLLQQTCACCRRRVAGIWPDRVARCACGVWVWLRPPIRFAASAVRRNDAPSSVGETYRPALTA